MFTSQKNSRTPIKEFKIDMIFVKYLNRTQCTSNLKELFIALVLEFLQTLGFFYVYDHT
jgi:hypothetical protein